MKRHLGAGVYLAIASMTAAVPAWAGGSPRAHDGGFFLRLSAGPSSDKTEFDDSDGKNEISGTGVDINLAAGAVVAENLALHATAFGWVVSNPTVGVPPIPWTVGILGFPPAG